MSPRAALAAAFVALVLVAAGLIWWVSAGDDPATEQGIEITYVDPLEPSDLAGLTAVARRPGNVVEFADLETLEGVTLDVPRQERPVPGFPDIAETPFGLVLVDGDQGVLIDGEQSTPTAPADALVSAGGPWVWHLRTVGDGDLEAVLVDVETGRTERGPILLAQAEVRAAPGLGLLLGDTVLGVDDWDLAGAEILAGGAAGVLVRDGSGHYTVHHDGADRVEVSVPSDSGEATFAVPSPDFALVVVLEREGARLLDLASGVATPIAPGVANPLRYAWLPDGGALTWMSGGRIYMLEPGSPEVVELGPATVAISYGNLEIMAQG